MNSIKRIRKRNGLSQQQTADLMHISRKHYGRVERGENAPSLRFLTDFSRVMHVEMGELLGEGGHAVPPGRTPAEERILDLYRMLDAAGRDYIYEELLMESAAVYGSREKERS